MAVASAGPYASLHLAPDRQPRQHPTTQFFTGRMSFMPPNQQHQTPDGKSQLLLSKGHSKHFSMLCAGSLTTENCSVAVFKSRLKTFLFSPGRSLFPVLSSTLPGCSTSEVIALWHYRHMFIIILLSSVPYYYCCCYSYCHCLNFLSAPAQSRRQKN